MSRASYSIRINSIFFKIGIVLVVCAALVGGTILLLERHFAIAQTNQLLVQTARSQASLVADVISGAVRFGKADLVTEVLTSAAQQADGQIVGSIVVGADETTVSQLGQADADQASLQTIAFKSLRSGKPAFSEDGLIVAMPLVFGSGRSIVGAVANQWSPQQLLEQQHQGRLYSLAAACVVLLVSILLSMLVFGRMIIGPQKRFARAIQDLAKKKYAIKVPGIERGDEIGDMGKSLDLLRNDLAAGELVQQDAMFKSAAFMGSSAAILMVDSDLIVQYLNPKMSELFSAHRSGFEEMLGVFEPDALVGKEIDNFHSEDGDLRDILGSLRGKTFDSILRLGESRISVRANGIRDDVGANIGFVLEWDDVTGNVLNRSIIEALDANQLRAEFDLAGGLISANNIFMDALELTQRDCAQVLLHEILSPSEPSQGKISGIVERVASGAAFAGRMDAKGRKGNISVIEGSLSFVKDQKGDPMRFLVLGRNVTVSDAELRAAHAQKQEAERQQSEVVDALRVGLRQLSNGDLTATINKPFAGTYEELRVDYNAAVENLAKALREVAENAENIHNDARDISSTADDLSRRTETTAATLEQTAAALDQLTSSVHGAATGARRADEAVSAAKINAEDSGRVVLDTVSAMDRIADSSEKITSIIKVIDDIAFQTNLLALNAGVEAARAGDAGRGFAVVASEVRALAQRSSDAAREINDLIAKSGTQVKTGVDLVGRTGAALRQIVVSVSEISTLVSDIAASSKQQSSSLTEINSAVAELDISTQKNAARLEETTAASGALRNDAIALVGTVAHFKIAEDTKETNGIVQRKESNKENGARASKGKALSSAASARSAPIKQSSYPMEKAATEWQDF